MKIPIVGMPMIAVFLLGFTAGCSGSHSPTQEPSASQSGLMDFLGWQEPDEHRSEMLRLEFEEHVQVCMRRLGFAYIPLPPVEGDAVEAALGMGLSDEEFAQQFGLGVSTRLGHLIDGTQPLPEPYVDPNQQQIDNLSEPERDAWLAALQGDDDATGFVANPETPAENLGCRRRAQARVYDDITPILLAFGDELDQMNERIAADPRLQEADRTWSECMAGQGFDYRSPAHAQEQAYIDFRGLQTRVLSDEDYVVGSLSDAHAHELTQLQQREIAVGVATLACGSDREAVLALVRREHELQFIQANEGPLLAAVEQSRRD